MRGINYLAGLGTLFVFAGFFCFKAVFHKETFKEKMEKVHYVPVKNIGKGYLVFLGSVCFILGALLILQSIKKII